MFEPGNILYGVFRLSNIETKPKYAIVLHKDDNSYILATFTTSQPRAGATVYIHGKNPPGSQNPKSHVFLATRMIGTYTVQGVSKEYHFPDDTTVVPDYGFRFTSITEFQKNVTNLVLKCTLYEKEYLDRIYTLYQCKKSPREYKEIYKQILTERLKSSKG